MAQKTEAPHRQIPFVNGGAEQSASKLEFRIRTLLLAQWFGALPSQLLERPGW